MREWVLSEQNHAFIRSRKWEVVMIPFGATEPHNLHMPYGTDNYQLEEISQKSCELAYKRGAAVLCLPVVPFGINTNYMKIPGSLACSLNPTTLYAIIGDLIEAMSQQGVRKIVLLNGHGGNELKPALREFHLRSKAFVCLCDWYRIGIDRQKEIFKDPGDHAGELESSLGMAFFPQFMKPELADEGKVRATRFKAISEGWINITRPWHLATTNTGAGDPSAASADKGHAYMDVVTERLSNFLVELAASPFDDNFPY